MLIVALLLFALFLSGVAAIINQTVWQRALKVYLAGSEAISSMIVVLVFMFGLGAGSFYMARSAHRVRNPMRLLAVVEMLLFAINLFIAFLLSLDISESVPERAAVSVGSRCDCCMLSCHRLAPGAVLSDGDHDAAHLRGSAAATGPQGEPIPRHSVFSEPLGPVSGSTSCRISDSSSRFFLLQGSTRWLA